MDLGRYRLVEPASAGRDGSRHLATSLADGRHVEVRVLSRAKVDPASWTRLASRLRLAKLIEHPSAHGILELGLELPTPVIVLEQLDRPTVLDQILSRPDLDQASRVETARNLASAVEAGHRVGLAHGTLGPATIRIDPDRGPLIDWTGTECDAAQFAAAEPSSRLCRPIGVDLESRPSLEADRFALGALIAWIVSGLPPSDAPLAPLDDFPGFVELIRDLTSHDPLERIGAHEVFRRLSAWNPKRIGVGRAERIALPMESATIPDSPTSAPTLDLEDRGRTLGYEDDIKTAPIPAQPIDVSRVLGRFQLLEKLGQGGMGSVFRAQDLSDGSIVAIKVLTPGRTASPQAIKRFLKEARVLSEVNSPYVTNLIEVNHDQDLYFLALEFVAGRDLTSRLQTRGPMDESTALSIAVDVAKALAVAHERGIVHRDVKPENILLVDDPSDDSRPPQVKLSDFGIAKELEDRESTALTQFGTILGTPLYMSPEQCTGSELGPWSDVYSMGATLFHMLTGRPPFDSDNAVTLIHRHRNEPAPLVRASAPRVSEATEQVVKKCLRKRSEERYEDAAELLSDLERLLRGEPTAIAVHPRLPRAAAGEVVGFDWKLDLLSSPERLWPHVSNTERFNRAVGLPAAEFRDESEEAGGTRRFGSMKHAGMQFQWREHPFEWIEGRRFGVLREYTSGPFRWFASVVELEPSGDGGTRLTHRLRIAPRGLLGKGIAAIEIGTRGRKSVEAVYRRIDAAIQGRLGSGADGDPFEAASTLSGRASRKLDRWVESLGRYGIDPSAAETLGDYLARAPLQEVSRIRPIALAHRLGLEPDLVINACLIGVREGILILLWDLICPICRVPSQVLDSLRNLEELGECPACRTDFPLDFARSVEMVCRLHPEIRPTEVGTYCIGGPANAPHVAAQVRIAPGERITLEPALTEGDYRLRGPQLSYHVDFRVSPGAHAARWELDLQQGPETFLPSRLRPHGQVITLHNPTPRELVVRIERVAPREDALSAARVSGLELFRALFPGELLQPGRLISLATITLLVTELPDAASLYEKWGDAGAFARIHEQFRRIEKRASMEGGTLVKTVREGVILSFDDARAAMRTALAIPETLASDPLTADFRPRIGLNRGSAMVATLNSHLDYFGSTVRMAAALPAYANPGGVALPSVLAADPSLAELIIASGRKVDIIHAEIPELGDGFVYRIGLERSSKPTREVASSLRSIAPSGR